MVTGTVFEFGEFKLDGEGFELRRGDRVLKLERKPMELLLLLAERSGHVVTRTEIAERLWEREVFVDTEHGINTAVRKIRQVLGDDPEQPRFVQTVTGRGYRFIAPVSGSAPAAASAAPAEEVDDAPPVIAPGLTAQTGQSDLDKTKLIAASSKSGHRALWVGVMGAGVAILCLMLAIRSAAILSYVRGGAHIRGGTAAPQIKSLAVIPLDNFSVEPGQEYLADGMTDELTTMLAKNSTLRVVSRTSVMQYKGAHSPLKEIAKELGVDGILEGSIARSGDKVHLNIQLIDAATDTHVWAESYDRDANDVVSLPRDAAQTVAKVLNSTVAPVTTRYVSAEAHDAYLHGMYLWFRGHRESHLYFEKAVELQPDYALGWSGLSDYYQEMADSGEAEPEKYMAKGEAAAIKAVELDDTLAQAHLAMSASDFIYRWNWAKAEQEIRRAMELDPRLAEAPHFYGEELIALNRTQEGIAEQKKATALDPFSRPWAMAKAYVMARQYDDAIREAQERLISLPHEDSLYGYLAVAYRCKGMQKESIEMEERALKEEGMKTSAEEVRRAYQRGGYEGTLLLAIQHHVQESTKHYSSPYEMAVLYAQLGRREEAIKQLQKAYEQHEPPLLWLQTEPALDFLHGDERYRAIIRKVGLPPAY